MLRDHTSTYTFTSNLKYFSTAPNKIITWIKFLFKILHRYLAQLQTYNAGEYSGKLGRELKNFGNLWLPTEPYYPDYNFKAERLNKTIADMERTILNACGLPSIFWSYDYSCSNHVHNLLPNKQVAPLTPTEPLFGTEPHPSQLYPFGCR
ncbi:hypothetical protein O181_033211 [Austropuccinia psidii MF-1]|uniref:Integrase catalytic domain-containing protein n=1 Tax=Austropuccinia psidii MF-1 TaxID=1389203 RepID=A0A9Q3H6V8_9BASI|nr:hypothetical protein [Austropuccinia psidii MF-1]